MIQLIGIIAREFIYSSHMLALDAVAMVLTVMLLYGYEIDLALLIIPYFVTQIIYSYNHLKEAKFDIKTNPERASLFIKGGRLKEVMFAFYVIFLALVLLSTSIKVILFVIFITIGGIFYTIIFKKTRILGFKNLYVSAFWVVTLLIVPIGEGRSIEVSHFVLMGIYFLTTLTSTIFFDIKDIEGDAERKILTFPVVIGLNKTLYLLISIKILSMLLTVVAVYTNILPNIFLWYLVAIIYGLVYILVGFIVKRKILRYVSYIFADAEFIFWLVVISVVKILT